jgi:hypothetical protein
MTCLVSVDPVRLACVALLLCGACGSSETPASGVQPGTVSTSAVAGMSSSPMSSGAAGQASGGSGGAKAVTPNANMTASPTPSAGAAAISGSMTTGTAGVGVSGIAGSAAVAGAGSASTATAGTSAAGASAGGAAGDTSAPPSAGGFPKTDAVNTDRMGPHQFMKYTDGLKSSVYSSAIVYYPTDAEPPFASMVFSPGFTATKEDYENFLGPLMASHGLVIMLTSPTSTSDQPPARADDLEDALKQIAAENEREGSPLKGKLATDRQAITGQSMGGGGTCIAANRLANKIRCAMPFEPWEPGMTFPKIQAPVMFIAAQSDTIAGVAQNALPFYMSVPDTVKKYYVEFAGASHYLTTGDQGTNYEVQSKYMIAFFKVYLEDDMRYMDVLNGMMDKELSKYMHSM